MTDATSRRAVARSLPVNLDAEAAEILRCLDESLRRVGFIHGLVLLLSKNGITDQRQKAQERQ